MKMVKLFTLSGLAMVMIIATAFRPAPEKEVTLQAEISGCGHTLNLYQFDGFGFTLIQSDENTAYNFSFTIPESGPQFYYLGPDERNAVPIILGTEQTVSVRGNCRQLRQLEFVDSPVNEQYRDLKKKMEGYNRKNSSLIRAIQAAGGDSEKTTGLLDQLKALDEERLAFLEQQKKENPFFGNIVSLNTYLSFPHNGQEYDNEVGYYADRFFQFADFKDEGYALIPWTYESFKGYATTLSLVGLPDDVHKMYIEKNLDLIPEGSTTQKLAYAGVLAALKQKSHSNYLYFADQFIDKFSKSDPEVTGRLKKELDADRNLMIGGTAPDFTQVTPDGQEMSLSDLRGKVVLLDFWASWCGPCRMENPNVVRVYQKYKEKGFDILSVSLDKNKDRWLQAIEKDNMTWHHVSDLKGWQNEVAQTYGVHSIPHTVLLDSDGKILARNLRGPMLEQKLAELFEQ